VCAEAEAHYRGWLGLGNNCATATRPRAKGRGGQGPRRPSAKAARGQRATLDKEWHNRADGRGPEARG